MGLVAVVAGGIGGGAEESRFLASLGMTMIQFVGLGKLGSSMLRHYKGGVKNEIKIKTAQHAAPLQRIGSAGGIDGAAGVF